MEKDEHLLPYTAHSVIPMHFMLQGDIRCILEGYGEAWLFEKKFNLFYIPGGKRHQAWFKQGFYISFHIDFSPDYLQWLATQYAELAEVSKRIHQQSTEGIQQHTAHITPLIRNIVDEIRTKCPKEDPQKSAFMEVKSKDLLLKYVQDMPGGEDILLLSGPQRLDAIIAHITEHLDIPFTIKSLSKTFHLSETALKMQFKKYTGQTIQHFIMEKRMTEAMRLRTTTILPVHDIAVQLGYYEFPSFDRAFRRWFGHPPNYYKK